MKYPCKGRRDNAVDCLRSGGNRVGGCFTDAADDCWFKSRNLCAEFGGCCHRHEINPQRRNGRPMRF